MIIFKAIYLPTSGSRKTMNEEWIRRGGMTRQEAIEKAKNRKKWRGYV